MSRRAFGEKLFLISSPPSSLYEKPANLQNYLVHEAFHNSHPSLTYPSVYSPIHPFMHLSTHSFDKYLLSTHCVTAPGDTTMNNQCGPWPHEAHRSSYRGRSSCPAIVFFGELVPHYFLPWPYHFCISDLSLQDNYKHNKTWTVSATVIYHGASTLRYSKSFQCIFCMNVSRHKFSAHVEMEGSFGDCTGSLKHWLIPSPASLHWPVGGNWKMRCFAQLPDLRTRNSVEWN